MKYNVLETEEKKEGTLDGKYMVWERPNRSLVCSMLEECRGNRKWTAFESRLKADPDCPAFGTLRYGFKTAMSCSLIAMVIKYAAPESTVTLDQLMAANGYVLRDEVERVTYSMQPMMQDKKDLRMKKWYSEDPGGNLVMAEKPFDVNDKEGFYEDYAVFICDLVEWLELNNEDAEGFFYDARSVAEDAFSHKVAVRMLHRYVFLAHDVGDIKRRDNSLSLLLDYHKESDGGNSELVNAYRNILIHLFFEHDKVFA